MGRALIVLHDSATKARALDWIARAPKETRVTFQGPKRTADQNSKLWAMLTEISLQVPWHGQRLSPEDYKLLFMAALNQEMRVVPNIAGTGFVPLGRSSSKLSKAEFADLITLIQAFAAERGVTLHEPQSEAA